MNSRERLMAGLLAVVGLAYGGNWFYRTKIAAPALAKQKEVDDLQVQSDDLDLKVLQQMKAERQLDGWRAAALSVARHSDAKNEYDTRIKALLRKAGIANPTVTPMAERSEGDLYTALPIQVSANCQLPELARFFDLLQRTSVPQRIFNWTLLPVVKDDKLDHFALTMKLEALAFKDLPLKQNKIEDRPRADGRKLEEFALFADKNVFQPSRVEAIPKEAPRVAAVAPPARDDRDKVKPVARVGVPGAEEISFHHEGGAPAKITVVMGGELKVPGMAATVAGFDTEANQVLLRVGGKMGAVKMGQALSTWKEVPVAVAGAKT